MSQEDFERFRQKVLQEPSLQKQLLKAENLDAFVRRCIELGQLYGCSFGNDEVNAALQSSRRAWIERGLG